MKKTFLSLFVTLSGMLVFAQDTTDVAEKSFSAGDFFVSVLIVLSFLAFAGVCLAIIIHIVKELFFRKKLVAADMETFRQARLDSGRSDEMTEEERAQATKLLQEVETHKTLYTDTDGTEYALPTKGKQVKAITRILAQVEEIAPTDEDMIEYYNRQVEIINEAWKRQFAGSKTYLIVSAVILLGMGLLSDGLTDVLPAVLIGSAIYIAGSMKPMFMFWRSEMKGNTGRSSFLTGIIGSLFGAVATAKTYKTVTKWSDGTTTTDTDDSETWLSLGFAFVVCAVLASLLTLCGFINYLRYYILYI